MMSIKKTVFFLATTKGNLKTVLLLLQENPALVFQINIFRQTALHLATLHNREDIVEALLHHQADPNAQDMRGKTPLHYAAEYGETLIVRMLKDAHAKPSLRDKQGYTPLDLVHSITFSQNNILNTVLEEKLERLLPNDEYLPTQKTWWGFFQDTLESIIYFIDVLYYSVRERGLSLWIRFKKPNTCLVPAPLYPQEKSVKATADTISYKKYANFEQKKSEETGHCLSIQTQHEICPKK